MMLALSIAVNFWVRHALEAVQNFRNSLIGSVMTVKSALPGLPTTAVAMHDMLRKPATCCAWETKSVGFS